MKEIKAVGKKQKVQCKGRRIKRKKRIKRNKKERKKKNKGKRKNKIEIEQWLVKERVEKWKENE